MWYYFCICICICILRVHWSIHFLFNTELKEVLKDNGGDNKSPKISVPHEIITNSDDSLAYEKGHFMYYSMEGEILIAGE